MRRRENGEKRMRGYVKLGEEEGKETHVKRWRKQKRGGREVGKRKGLDERKDMEDTKRE